MGFLIMGAIGYFIKLSKLSIFVAILRVKLRTAWRIRIKSSTERNRWPKKRYQEEAGNICAVEEFRCNCVSKEKGANVLVQYIFQSTTC